jgi:hypothetical protein
MAEEDVLMIHEELPGCSFGRHRARRVRLVYQDGKIHSKCRDCGCELVRTQATRQWYYSGPLGVE